MQNAARDRMLQEPAQAMPGVRPDDDQVGTFFLREMDEVRVGRAPADFKANADMSPAQEYLDSPAEGALLLPERVENDVVHFRRMVIGGRIRQGIPLDIGDHDIAWTDVAEPLNPAQGRLGGRGEIGANEDPQSAASPEPS